MSKPNNLSHIPDQEIEILARCFLPSLLKFFESEEGQKEFERWQQQQGQQNHE